MSGFGNIHRLIPDLKKLGWRVLLVALAGAYIYVRYFL